MAKKKKIDPKSEEAVYAYKETTSAKRFLWIVVAAAVVATTIIIRAQVMANQSWIFIALAALTICAPIIFYPEDEKWVYTPWQRAAQRLESHHIVKEPVDSFGRF